MNAQLTILGNNSAAPTKSRNPSGQVLSFNGERVLIDCGEGSQKRMLLYGINYQKIDFIFISHLHGDHYLGLMGLLNTMSLNGRKTPLKIVCPKGLKDLHERIVELGNGHSTFDIEFTELDEERIYNLETSKWWVKAIPVSHRIPCYSYLFREKKHHRSLNIAACKRYNVPRSEYNKIKAGEDYVTPDGERIPNSELSDPPPKAIGYGYITDTLYRPDLTDEFAGCSAVYHETTYLHNLLDRAIKTGHSTALQAGEFAKKATVNQLLIGHFSSRYDEMSALLEEAKSVFPNTVIAEEGNSYEIS
ncbi:MAG: ribonuclease Z [Bacteroidia bacterium]|nr:ribonuclease Z [Bacteroidia bacterium]